MRFYEWIKEEYISFYNGCGGGHRSIGNSLLEGIKEKKHDWNFNIINAYEIADFTAGDSIYNFFQKYTLLKVLWWPLMIPLFSLINAVLRTEKKAALAMRDYLRSLPPEKAPDLFISNSPHLHYWIRDGIKEDYSHIPFLVYIPDFEETPHRFMNFIAPFQEDDPIKFHYICSTPKAAEQVREAGYPDQYISEIPGVVINKGFYGDQLLNSQDPEKIRKYRVEEELEPHLMTGLVMFGGKGSSEMVGIANKMLKHKKIQLIFICGNNMKLKARLEKLKTKGQMPWLIKGFTKEIPHLMSISDFFIGKPGPGSLSEAVHMNLPVITIDNFTVLLQEKANPQWIRENNLGVVLKSFSEIEKGINQICDEKSYTVFKDNCSLINNDGLYSFINLIKHYSTFP